jgi:hypothetical protein
MVTIIIFLVLAVVIGIFQIMNGYDDYFLEGAFRIFFFALFGVVIGFIFAIILPSKMIEQKSTFKLMNLQDGSQISGNFFLGSGVVEGKMNYVFYYAQDSNTFAMSQIKYDVANIKYTKDSTTAYIECYKTVDDPNWFWNNFSYDTYYGDCRYIIYVPKGTIKTNYNLDAQ